jgi:PAS domain S-box-containing protein
MGSDSNFKKEWLTKRAEELLKSKEKLSPLDFSDSLEELVESLQIYQIELEMQNTELIRVQQSLDREKSRFETLFNHAPVGYCSLYLNGELLEANKAFCRILALSENQSKGKHFSIFVHPDSQDDFYIHLRRVKDTLTDHSTILRVGNTSTVVYIKLHSSVARFEGDDNEVLLCTISDITNEVLYQRDLHQSEERFRSLVTSIDDVVFTLDKNQRHTAVYGKWLEKFNQTPDDYLGKTSADMMGNELAQIHEKNNTIALEGQSVVYEWNIDFVEGKQYFQTSLSPIFAANREVVGLAGVARNITDLKSAELALAEKELQYRTLADSGQALIWASGLDMKCNYFNQVWLSFTGRKIEQELGDGWTEGVHPEDMERCIGIYTNAFKNREKFSMPYRLRHFTGEYRWIQDDGTPNYNSKGEFLGYIGHCLDISERKNIEEELRHSEEKFRVIFDNAPVGIFHYNQEGIITACNDAFVSIIGSTQAKLIGLNVLDLPNAEVANAIKLSLEGKKAYFEGYYSPVTADKSLFVKLHIEPAQYQDGEITGGIAIVEDITQQRLAEDALRDSEENFRTLVDSANDIIYTVSPEGVFTFASPNWQSILGHKQDEVIGKSLADFVHPDDVHLCASFLQKILETQKPQSGVEYRVLHKDGKWRWHRSNGSVRKLKDGTDGYVGVAHDITDLKLAERSLVERMKEINCLYDISSLGHNTEMDTPSYLQQCVSLIPSGFKNPQNTGVRIALGDYLVQTDNFVESANRLTTKIKLEEVFIGSIEIVLIENIVDDDKPFLDEEQTLIELIADGYGAGFSTRKDYE